MRLIFLALSTLVFGFHIVKASANSIILECSYDAYARPPFIVGVSMDNSTVTVSHPAENIGGIYVAPIVEGPYSAVISNDAISWNWKQSSLTGDTSIDRITGKALDNISNGLHVVWSCHATQNKF